MRVLQRGSNSLGADAAAVVLAASRSFALGAILCVLFACFAVLSRADAPPSPRAGETAMVPPLVIEAAHGPVAFSVELAQTPAEHARGLQERRTLASDAGMLFDFDPPRVVSMWMKDTYIPLDMLFIDAAGVVMAIVANTKPHALDIISPPYPVRAVLELNAGTAARLGIRAGDRVTHPIFVAPK